jgi:hypothetical protein
MTTLDLIPLRRLFNLGKDIRQAIQVLFAKPGQQLIDRAHVKSLVLLQGSLAFNCQAHVNFAFVARVDLAGDEGLLAFFQGADDAGHLRRQHAENALDVADDHCALALQDDERQELRFLEVAQSPAGARQIKTKLRGEVEYSVCDLIDSNDRFRCDHGVSSPFTWQAWLGPPPCPGKIVLDVAIRETLIRLQILTPRRQWDLLSCDESAGLRCG